MKSRFSLLCETVALSGTGDCWLLKWQMMGAGGASFLLSVAMSQLSGPPQSSRSQELCHLHAFFFKKDRLGLPWWSMLPVQEVQNPSLVHELRSHMP